MTILKGNTVTTKELLECIRILGDAEHILNCVLYNEAAPTYDGDAYLEHRWTLLTACNKDAFLGNYVPDSTIIEAINIVNIYKVAALIDRLPEVPEIPELKVEFAAWLIENSYTVALSTATAYTLLVRAAYYAEHLDALSSYTTEEVDIEMGCTEIINTSVIGMKLINDTVQLELDKWTYPVALAIALADNNTVLYTELINNA